MAQISYGTLTIIDTTDIERMYAVYAKSISNLEEPSTPVSVWTEDIETAPGEGNFIWQCIVIKKSGIDQPIYGDPICITGASGKGVVNIITTYCNYGTGRPSEWYEGWENAPPSYDATKPNYWVKIVINYTDETSNVKIYKDNGLTDSIDKSSQALEQSQEAVEKARATEQHFWFTATGSGSLPAGAYITESPINSFKNIQTGGWLSIRSDGLILGKDTNKYMELDENSLNFYRAGTSDAAASLDINGLNIQKGSISLGEYFNVDTNGNFTVGEINTGGEGILWDGNRLIIKTKNMYIGDIDITDTIQKVEETLRYDTNFTESNGVYNFTAVMYSGEEDITNTLDPDRFVWYLRTEEEGDTFLSRGYSVTVAASEAKYRGTVIGGYEDAFMPLLITESNDFLITNNNELLTTYIGG